MRPRPTRSRVPLLVALSLVALAAIVFSAVTFADGSGGGAPRAASSRPATAAGGGSAGGASTTAASGASLTAGRPAPIIYRPAGLSTARKVPLLMAFYGADGCPQCMEGLSHFESLANQYGFVVAYPGSTVTNGNVWRSSTDVAYVSSLISQIEANPQYNVDPNRVYVTGFSAGGRFAYQVACDLSRQVAAFAAVSGLDRPYACPLTHPVSELSVFGGSEMVVNGNPSSGAPSQRTVEAWWRQRDGCTGAVQAASVYPLHTETSGACADGSRVKLIIIQGGIHTWPGCSCKVTSSGDSAWNASQGIWAFLSPLRRGSLTVPDARLLGVHVSGNGAARRIQESYRLGERVAVTQTLSSHGNRVAATTTNAAPGRPVAALAVPATAGPGTYTLRLKITDAYGRTLVLTRSVRVPA